jgi:predicted outer membrane repeat protein
MTLAERLATILFVAFVLLVLPQPAQAQKTIKVGNGTAASCTEDALRNALALAGGERSSIVQFKCGAVPVMIAVTATLTVPDNTRINGAGLITLDGPTLPENPLGNGPILRVDRESTVALQDLNIHRGAGCTTCEVPGGGIHNEGTLTVDGCTFSGNAAVDGGGIFNQGTLTVRDSTFSDNSALHSGGGIFSQGTLAIHGSTFTGNGSTFGAAIIAEGTLTVHDSVFDGNNVIRSPIDLQAFGLTGFPSGAINLGMGTHTISHGTITRNISAESGGGITLLAGALTVIHSTITQNTAAFGGGIEVLPLTSGGATLAVKNSTISGNTASREGGGIANNGGTVTIDDSTITQNTAGTGGGMSNGGSLKVKDSTITENAAGTFGGGIYNLSSSSAVTLTVIDSAITQNTAGSDGGGIYTVAGGIPPRLKKALVTNNTPNDIAP